MIIINGVSSEEGSTYYSEATLTAIEGVYDSSAVVANSDGNVLERLEGLANTVSANLPYYLRQSESVAPNADVYASFFVNILASNGIAIPSGDININDVNIRLEKSASGGAYSIAGVTQPTLNKLAGQVYTTLVLQSSEGWDVNCTYRLTLSSVKITIGITEYTLQTFVWNNIVSISQSIDSEVDALTVKLAKPAQDSADDNTIAEVVGTKADTIAGTSLVARTKQVIADLSALGIDVGGLDTKLDAISGYIDTEVQAIKVETDKIPATIVKVDAIKTETDKIPATIIKIDGEVIKTTAIKTETDKIPATITKIDNIKIETDKIPAEVVKTAAIKTETDKIPATIVKVDAIKVATDQVGTLTNTGGVATLAAMLGDTANLSVVARLTAIASYIDTEIALIKTETDQIGTVVNTGGTATLAAAIGDTATSSLVARLVALQSIASLIKTETDKIAAVKLSTDAVLADTLGFRFKVNVETAGASGAGKFALPVNSSSVCSFTVHWGDGKSDVITAYNQTEVTHTYPANGIYEIKITDSVNKITFYSATVQDRLKLVEVINIPQTVLLGNGTSYPFRSCTNMTAFNSYAKIKLIGDCAHLMRACSSLTSLDMSIFDTMDCTSLQYAFREVSKVTTFDITSWNVSKITNLLGAFDRCSLLISVNMTGLDFVATTAIEVIFNNCYALTSVDLTPFTNSPLTSTASAFSNCTALTSIDLTPLKTTSLLTISSMFIYSGLTSLTWTNKIFTVATLIDYLTENCDSLISLDLSGCSFPSVVDSYYLTDGCALLETVDLSGCSFPAMKVMYAWFDSCPSLTSVDFTGITTGVLENVGNLFEDCTSLVTVDTSPINFSTVKYFRYMFNGCTSLTSARIDVMDVRSAVAGATGMSNFATGVTFDTTEYSNALIYWATLPVQTGVVCDMGNSKYNSSAVSARAYLVGTKGWTLVDGGLL
jgi:hypothetical protein